MKVFYVALVLIVLIVVGQWNSKIGLALAALIFLSTTIMNIDNFKKIANGEVFK